MFCRERCQIWPPSFSVRIVTCVWLVIILRLSVLCSQNVISLFNIFIFFLLKPPMAQCFYLFIYLFGFFSVAFFFLCFLPASLRLPKQWQRTQLNDKWHPGQCVCLEWEWGGLITLDTKGFFISQSGRTQCTYLPLGEVGFKAFILMLAKMLV